MGEKCWCGKELEVRLGGYYGRDAYAIEVPVCPVHGKAWQLTQKQVIALVEAVKAIHDQEYCSCHGPCLAIQLKAAALALLPKQEAPTE